MALRDKAAEKQMAAEDARVELQYIGAIVNASPTEKDFTSNVAFERRLLREAIFPRTDIKGAV